MVDYAKQLEDATKGRVKITVYGGATLGPANQAFSLVTSGMADIAWGYTGLFPGQFPLSEIITLPLLAANPAAEITARAFWGISEKFPEAFAKEYGETKVLVLHTGGKHLVACTSKKAVRTRDDIKGLNIRTPAGPPTDMLKALGGNPIQMGTADIYLAMEKGTIDGYSIGFAAIKDNKWYEVSKYFTEAYLCDTTFWVLMNKKVWDSMPSDIQQQIMSVSGEKGSVFYSSTWDGMHAEAREFIKAMPGKEFITLSPDEMSKWTALAKPIWDDYVAKLAAKGLPAREVLNEALNIISKYSK